MKTLLLTFGRLSGVWLLSSLLSASALSEGSEPIRKNIEFATVDGHRLLLDFYQPALQQTPAPLVVWVHGGAWRSGSRSSVPIAAIVNHGFAVASVDYRLSPVAAFPAQAYDIKAAVRFLRNHSEDFGIDPDRIAIAGASAGGHLAALVGMSNRVRELEGRTGRDGDVSSDVQAVVSFYGASNLQTILAQSTPHGLSVRVPALQLLLKGQPEDKQQLAKLASPVSHVDRDDPPLLLIHGDQDPQMPINQSHELHGACRERGVTVEFDVVYGAAHGGSEFYTDARIRRVAEFLRDAMPTD